MYPACNLPPVCCKLQFVSTLVSVQWYGLEEVVSVGVVLALANLSYRGTSPSHPWPTATLSDHTVVSQNPREKHLKQALDNFLKQLPVSW